MANISREKAVCTIKIKHTNNQGIKYILKNYSNTMDAIFSSYTKNYAVLEIDLQIFEDIFKEFDDEYFENISPFEKKKGISDLLTNTDSRFMFVLCRYTK